MSVAQQLDDPLGLEGFAPLPGYSYKFASSTYGLDTAVPGLATFDEADFSITVPFASSLNRDRVGDLLEIAGIDTTNHRGNPVAFLDHGRNFHLPIGKCEDAHGAYTVTLDEARGLALAKIYLSKKLPEAAQVFELWREGILRAGSIGYRPLLAKKLPANPDTGTPPGLHLLKVELLEPSCVGLPVNPDAVRRALNGPVCGKSLLPALRACLEPFAPTSTTAVVRNFMATKALPPQGGTQPAAPPAPATDPQAADPQKLPQGVKSLAAVHGALKTCKAILADHLPLNERPSVCKCLSKLSDHFDSHLSDVKSCFKGQYPDVEGIDDDEDDQDQDTPPDDDDAGDGDGDDDDAKKKALLAKTPRLKMKRKAVDDPTTKPIGSTVGGTGGDLDETKKPPLAAVKDAAEFLGTHGQEANLTDQQKSSVTHHAEQLKGYCKGMEGDDEGGDDADGAEVKALLAKITKNLAHAEATFKAAIGA